MDIQEWKRQRDEEREREEQRRREASAASIAADTAPKTETAKTFEGFMKNLGSDAVGIGKGVAYPITNTREFFGGMKGLVVNDEGDFDLSGIGEAGSAVVDRYKEIASEPGNALYEQPLSTLMDIASVAFPVRGVAKGLGAAGLPNAANATNKVANAIQSVDPVSMATTGVAAVNAAVTNPVAQTKTVLKPGSARTNKFGDPEFQDDVIQSALDRGISASESGLAKLDKQIETTGKRIQKVLENSNVRIPMGSIVEGFEDWAKSQLKETENNRAAVERGIEAKSAEIKDQYSLDNYGDPIDYRDAAYLREMRQSADGEINHNKRSQQNDSAKVRVDKLYAQYLRERLAVAVPELRPLNDEMHTLLKIDDLYTSPVTRNAGHNPFRLTDTISLSGAGVGGSWGVATENWPMTALAGGLGLIPPLMNSQYRRNKSADSANRSQSVLPNVPGENFVSRGVNAVGDAVGSVARDRNNIPFYLRQGGSFMDALSDELMRQEEEY